MKKILGLDIGTTSIGWAIIEAKDEKKKNFNGEVATSDINNDRIGIHKGAIGVRIISQDTERFNQGKSLNDSKGSALTPTAQRRKYRGSRKLKSRYKLRRGKLEIVLNAISLEPDQTYYTKEKGKRGNFNDIGRAIYELRDRAIREKITLGELGRILMHLNQWRGYSSDRFKKDEGETTKKGDKEIFTSIVVSIDGPIPHDKKYHRFKIAFEDGNVGWQIRKTEKIESDYKIDNQLCSYSFNEKFNLIEDIRQIEKEKEVDKNSYAFRKKEINDSIKEFIGNTNGTVGSFFFQKYYTEKTIDRIRNNHVDRDWYEDELNKIWNFQFEEHHSHFEKLNIQEVVKIAFKDYKAVLSEVLKKNGIKEQLKYLIKDKIIYYQRPWQQAKNKGECPFEYVPDVKKVKDGSFIPNKNGKRVIDKKGNEIFLKGRTVIPRSHPLYQTYKIWQQINNVRIYLTINDERNDLFDNPESFIKYVGKSIPVVKHLLFVSLQNCKTLSWKNFAEKELKLKNKIFFDESSGEILKHSFSYNFRKQKRDGSYEDIKLKGNTTKVSLQNIISDKVETWFFESNSVICIKRKNKQKVEEKNNSYQETISNLQLLWEIIYDITNSDANKVSILIEKYFAFEKSVCDKLANIRFDDAGMGNISAKAIRQLLPLMSDGNNITEKSKRRIDSLLQLNNSNEEKTKDNDEKLESLMNFVSDKKARLRLSKLYSIKDFRYLNYWEAAAVIYGSHSTKRSNIQTEIGRVKQHSMNNPIVEKIVNETISIVNEINNTYGFDEVRIELSRELKASMEEREQMYEAMQEGNKKNEWAKQMLRELKQALNDDDRKTDNIDDETSTKNNLDKIKIIEDVVKFQNQEEYKKKSKELNLSEPSNSEVKKYLMWLEQNFRCPYTNQPIPLTDVFAKGKVVEIEHILPKERYYSNAYSNKVITWHEVNQAKANNGNRTAFEFIVSKRVENAIKVGNRDMPLVSAEGWKQHVEGMFSKGAKRTNLLRKEIPEDPISRTIKETQYISKKLKEKLGEIVGENKVWVTSGAVTDILRERWHLNDVMRDLLRNRYEEFNIGENKHRLDLIHLVPQFNPKTRLYENVEVFEGYSKRVDHRHHALDALIIACTKQHHIQYINTLNTTNSVDQDSEDAKKAKYSFIKKDVCESNSSKKFIVPWGDKDNFVGEVKRLFDEIAISHKNVKLLISPSKHRIDKISDTTKLSSIRGELHKETNYASRNYFENDRTTIVRIIPLLLQLKMDNQLQSMVHFKSFEEVIKETVLKEKYQNILILLFNRYENEKLNKDLCKEIGKKMLAEIANDKLLFNIKTGKPLEWLSTYSIKNKSVRPNGHLMNLNDIKEIKDIADPRIKRLAGYRLEFINSKKREIDNLDIPTSEKNKLKREVDALPLYSNAIYEVRIKNGNHTYEWVEIKDIKNSDFEKIEYPKKATTDLVKNKLKESDFERLHLTYLTNPIFITDTPIQVKKVRQKSFFQDLYEINKGRFVYSRDVFMTYFFIEKGKDKIMANRIPKFLKYIDAVSIINTERPSKIDYAKLIDIEKSNSEIRDEVSYELLFTLAKNDLVYLLEPPLRKEQIESIDWADTKSILPKLYIVKDMEASNKRIIFQQFYKADSITISEADAQSLFKNHELKKQIEEIKYGTVPMLQSCIKVFTDKLGKKIVPYWEFPNGCWSKEKALVLGLIKG